MPLAIAPGTDGDGVRILACIDGTYRKIGARSRRDIVVVVRVSGERILEDFDARIEFEDMLTASLAQYGGLYAASYTRFHPHASYTWLYYASADVQPGDVPVPSAFASQCHVAVARDPNWREYETLSPRRPNLVRRVLERLKRTFTLRPPLRLIEGNPADKVVAVLNAMARHGADLSKETDVVFYLYFKNRENAVACARDLWDQHFRAEVLMPPPASAGSETGDWLVRARQDLVPELATIRTANDALAASASRHDGVYDGWEAALQR